MIHRILYSTIKEKIFKGKTIIITGPRQTGKTTLIHEVLKSFGEYLFLDGDDTITRQMMEGPSYEKLKQIIGSHKLVFIDEAQRIGQIGLTLKMIHDRFKEVQLLVSGSSALDIGNETNEPLTGRKWEYLLLPISWEELQNQWGYLSGLQQLENRLIFGMYPDVLNHPGEEEKILRELASAYLYKDILALTGIKKPDKLEKLLQALALQCGSEVSYNEIAQLISIDKNTVSTYIDLLEKTFVVFRLPAFSRNARNEIKNSKKIFFYDNGIRNAIINNFNPPDLRQDKGALWENFIISERKKYLNNRLQYVKTYFWRTAQQQEIDYIEEKNGDLNAYEIKWKINRTPKLPSAFSNAYQAILNTIDKDNFTDFVTEVPRHHD